MDKTSLNSRHDYSSFDIPRSIKRYPFKDILEDKDEYHLAKTKEALSELTALNELKVTDYFRYFPGAIDRLKEIPGITDVEAMNMHDLFAAIYYWYCDEDDESYRQAEDAIGLIFLVIEDSGFDHPLYRASAGHINGAMPRPRNYPAYIGNLSMNSFLRSKAGKKQGQEKYSFFAIQHYIESIIIPSISLTQNSLDEENE
ncbi:MAG: hypothetical protein K5745_09195 [Saccharofermentans sp.]|nr:hypothetical protein [Saccharofermentans sp.]